MAIIWPEIRRLTQYLQPFRKDQLDHGLWYAGAEIVCTSGGFDPIHGGHIRLLMESKRYGDILVVIANGDGFLRKKKGYVFMPVEDRLAILANISGVDHVTVWNETDTFVNEALEILRPDVFTKGGDRNKNSMALIEVETCKKIGCEIKYGVGGEKIQSSSKLLRGRDNVLGQRTSEIHCDK